MSGYVWPLATVSAVKGLRTAVSVDPILMHRDREAAATAIRERLVKALSRHAEPWAVVIDPGDCRFLEQRDEPFGVKVECSWSPATDEVELRGGPADGEVVAVRDVGEPLKIAVRQPIHLEMGDGPEAALTTSHVTYSLGGWSEGSRRWVYDC